MGFTIEKWNSSHQIIDNQVQEFKQKLNASLSLNDIEKIDHAIQNEVQRLELFSMELEDKKRDLENGCFSLNFRKIIVISGLTFVSSIISIGALTCQTFAPDDELTDDYNAYEISGFICGVLSILVTLAVTIYSTKIFFDVEEKCHLNELHEEGIQNAKIFLKFIKHFKEIKALQANAEQATHEDVHSTDTTALSDSSDDSLSMIDLHEDLDEKIIECIKRFEQLPKGYREKHTFCRLISILIRLLPDDDPLKQKLYELEQLGKKVDPAPDQASSLDKLTLNYQSSSNDIPVYSIKLEGEQSSKKPITINEFEYEYQDNWKHLTSYIGKRFWLKPEFEFLETSDGTKLTSEGLIT